MKININSPAFCKIKNEKIILDTNILLIMFFSYNMNEESKDYKKQYQNFIKNNLKNNTFFTSRINICESFHVIDKTKLEMYNNEHKTQISIKEFHYIKEEIEKTRKDMKIFYECVKNVINILPNEDLKEEWMEEYLNSKNSLDLYDFALIKIAQENNIKNILTNDYDFVSDPDLVKNMNIYSQNSRILNSD